MHSIKIQPRTNENMGLTTQQVNHYIRDGYLIIENCIPHHVCHALMQRANQLVQHADLTNIKTVFSTTTQQHAKDRYFLESGTNISFFFEEKSLNNQGDLLVDQQLSINKIGHALHELDPLFYCFSHLHQHMQLAEKLGMIDPIILQSMYIFKQPNIGGEVTCHQDATYLYLHNTTVTGFWFALEDATIENGCLWAIPGGHLGKLKSRMIRDANDNIVIEQYDHTPYDLTALIPLAVKKGSLVILHGLLPHMSHENKSGQSRHAYAIHLASRSDEYAENNWLRRSF